MPPQMSRLTVNAKFAFRQMSKVYTGVCVWWGGGGGKPGTDAVFNSRKISVFVIFVCSG